MANYLNNAIARYRAMGQDLMGRADELDNAPADYAAFQALAKQRRGEADTSMLNALAAQFAGEDFQPVQAQFLKRAMAAQEPVKIGNYGYVGNDGQVVIDPMYQREKTIDNLRRRAISFEQLATNAETAAEKRAADAQYRQTMADIARMNAETQRMLAVGKYGDGTQQAPQYSAGGEQATPRIITPDVQPDEALGLYGKTFSLYDRVADAVGVGNPNAPSKVATERLESLGNQTQLYLQDAVPGRPSNYLLQMMEKQAIRPNQVFLGKAGASARAEATQAVIDTGLNDLSRILNNPQGYSNSDIAKARDSYSRLSALKAEYNALSQQLANGGQAQESGLPPDKMRRLQELREKAARGEIQ